LAAANIKLGIVSSDTPENVQDFVARYDLHPLFQVHLGSTLELSKPNPQLFYRACEYLGVAPEETLAIGDATSDIQMAHAAGAAGCICVTWGWSGKAQLSQANSLITSFSDLQISSG
jgi:phosphoglycolate phosphatase